MIFPDFLQLPKRMVGAVLRRTPRAVLRAFCWGTAVAYVLLAVFVMVMRWSVLPAVEDYRADIEQVLSRSIKLPVRIEKVSADWRGLRPHLGISGLQLLDAQGRVALRLERVDAEVGWLSLLTASVRLHRLEVVAPALSIRRELDGRIYVAGIKIDPTARGGDVSDWVLRQSSIVIRGAAIEWSDAVRAAPPLALQAVNFRLDNSGSRHRFGLQAAPPQALASRLDVRGDLRGQDVAQLGEWRGELYAELDNANLAGWGAWVDYPVWLPHGAGSLRLWTRFADRHINSATADLALRGVTVRLTESLPVLDLEHLTGRLNVRLPARAGEGYELGGRGLSLTTRDGVRVPGMDFTARWTPASTGKNPHGEFLANALDFTALARLAQHVPLDAALRARLERFAPTGRVADLKLNWTGPADALASFGVKAKFSGLGILPVGVAPGFEGMSGTLDATEKAGTMTLAARNAAVSLPAVFPEPRIALDELDAYLQWTVSDGVIDAHLQNLTLANTDAAGHLSGHWRGRAGQGGEIDLTANLSRARGDAVWRYLPKVVGERARDWVRTAIVAGGSNEARLRLKGSVAKFPFVDAKDGTFQVAAKLAGVTLDYIPGWPRAENVAGDLLFQGTRMLVRAQSGTILGAQVAHVSAEIPDLLSKDSALALQGEASGPTAEFLKYVAQSPLSRTLGPFAESVQASGPGKLALKLTVPLHHAADTRVSGEYAFKANRLAFGTALPAITDATARVVFSEGGVTVREGGGNLFGTPFTLAAQTRVDGAFTASAQGRLVVADIRRTLDAGVLEHLAGSAPWQASLTVRKGAVSAVVESSLQGISSSLPAPFNKPAADAMPLRLEFADIPANGSGVARDQLRATLGRVLAANVLRRREGAQASLERGVIAIGESPVLPERGLLLSGTFKSVDYRAWSRALAVGGRGGGAGWPISAFSLRTNVLTFGSQLLNDVSLHATTSDSAWQAKLSSREATGEINYRNTGKGRVFARFKNLAIAELPAEDSTGLTREDSPTELPALDVVADNFSLKGHALGKLELQAVNRAAVWRMEKLSISNPDGTISGDAQWRAVPPGNKTAEPQTQINLKVDSGNVGRFLERVGYPDAVRRGSGKMEAKLSWAGAPTQIDYPSLSGEVRFEASNGQFSKFEPGVGRLLGVLSLQSLPRRITLDFRDVFSEGFAFDSISGSMKVHRGVMSSDDLRIRGPAAKVAMKGEVDLAQETQNLRVKVQPTLSDSLAIGAAIANPVAGVATFLAQKVLRDPFEKMFAFEYAVTGTWSDPKVEKMAAEGAIDADTDSPANKK